MVTPLTHTNWAKTTLTATITNVATTITVSDGSVFPASGEFYVTLFNQATYPDPANDAAHEIVLVTSRSNNVLTATRAQDGTSGAAHYPGQACELRLNAANMTRVWSGITDCVSVAPTGTRNTITAGAASVIPLKIVGAVSQTANLLEATSSAGTVVLSLSPAGVLTIIDGGTIVAGSSTGLKIGTATTQKLGFYNHAPAVQPAAVTAANASYTTGNLDTEAEIIAALNATNATLNTLITRMQGIGLLG